MKRVLWLILVLSLPLAAQDPDDESVCLMVAAQCIAKGGGNFYLYYKISQQRLRIARGDKLEYDVFLHPDCPELKGGIDIQLAGGASLRDSGAKDQDGVSSHGDAILEKAKGQWHHRVIELSHLAGRVTERWDVQFEGDSAGLYIQFIGDVAVTHESGGKTVIYSKGKPSFDMIDWKEGYSQEAKSAVVPRGKIKAGADLDKFIEKELRAMRLRATADLHRQQWDYVSEILKREKRDDLIQVVEKAKESIPDPEKFEGSVDDYRAAIRKIEATLAEAAPIVRKFTGHCVGYGHIDIIWLWQWPETIKVTHDTFAQALKFIDEVPGYTYTHSCATLYEAMEKHHPEIFWKIQEQVKKGRWEVVGGRWCEGDQNMISPESHARHFLYAQRYFREKLGVTARVGWEPDTFGHTWQMPQLLRLAGIDTYYFCRAGKGKPLFDWEAPDGSRVLAFEQSATPGTWYMGDIDAHRLQEVLQFNDKTGSRDMIWVYGVGNHGGGPTRENIQHALEMQKKEFLPNVKFSGVGAFFDAVKKTELKQLPVIKDELNTVFEGCYTTHGEIKRYNRDAESLTVAAEAAAALASRYGYAYPHEGFVKNWHDILWNHHHDTIPGSSIHPAYEESHTRFKRVLESSGKILAEASGILADHVKDAKPGELFVLNTLGWSRDALVRVLPRDGVPDGALVAVSPDGDKRSIQREPSGSLVFVAKGLPAFGYRVYRIEKSPEIEPIKFEDGAIHTDRFDITVDPDTGAVTKLYDKRLKRETLSGPAGDLVVFWEKPHGMSAWEIGPIDEGVKPSHAEKLEVVEAGPVFIRVRAQRKYGKSTIEHDLLVYRDLDRVEFDLNVDWQEKGSAQKGNPFLKARFPIAAKEPHARYAIPFGDIERPMNDHEYPALQWADIGDQEGGVALLNDCKHGHSANSQGLKLSLLRASYDPDPTPDIGHHFIRYALYPHKGSIHEAQVTKRGFEFGNAPVAVWIGDKRGNLPREKSFLQIEGALPTALKLSEDGDEWVVRFYESTGAKSTVSIRGAGKATELDLLEDKKGELDASAIPLRGYEIKTVKLAK